MRTSDHVSWEVVLIIFSCLLVLSTNMFTEVYAFHGNATEDALLESPGTTSPSTDLACEVGTDNEAVLNIVNTSKGRATFQCITNSTIVFSFGEENAVWGWSIIELLKSWSSIVFGAIIGESKSFATVNFR
jgi:hypothetical protein